MYRVEIVLISDQFQIVFAEDAGNTLVSPPKEEAHTDKARPDSAETVSNQRDILGEPGERNPAFAVDYLSCASKTQRTVEKEKKRGLWTAALSHIYRIKPQRSRRVAFFSPHPKGKDGFIHMALWMFTGLSLAFSSQNRGKR